MTSSAPPAQKRRNAVPFQRGHAVRLRRHAEAPDPADLGAIRDWVKQQTAPTAVDLFAGAGGLSLGLKQAGFSVLAGADSDAWAVETHTANVGGLGYVGDLGDPREFLEHLDGWGIEAVDLVVGGVPCQPFSRAGYSKIRDLVRAGVRSKADPRAELWTSFMQVVKRLRPRAVLVENVPDLPSWDDGAVLIGFFESLRALGYEVSARVLDGFDYGVPQHRARLIIVGLRDCGALAWPEPQDGITTLRDAIGDLPPVPGGQRTEDLPYRPRGNRPLTPFQERMRTEMPEEARALVHDHITRAVRPDDMQAFELLPEGGTYSDLPAKLQRYRTDIFTDKYKRLAWGELSRTITAHLAKDGYWYIHPEQHRTLSIREAARIQTFPDWFRFAGQPSHRYRQIGNAVPPMLGDAVGRCLFAALTSSREPPRKPERTIRQQLLRWHGAHARAFPWRYRGSDPWSVLMAELCLARTRADQVAPLYRALRGIAPDATAVAADPATALLAMRALGLRAGAQQVVAVAEAVVDLFDGRVPDKDFELRTLPGVGDYAAQAVLCFGFGRRSVLLDQNTMRIVGRISGHADSRRWQLRLDLHQLAGADGPGPEFNHALLDLGALVCRPAAACCDVCPVRDYCATGSGATPQLPSTVVTDELPG
jgi:DNA (cytosine-5)-methyltransferase 1